MRAKLNAEALEFFRKQGVKGGTIGGKVAAKNMTKAERIQRAKKASAARWAKAKKGGK